RGLLLRPPTRHPTAQRSTTCCEDSRRSTIGQPIYRARRRGTPSCLASSPTSSGLATASSGSGTTNTSSGSSTPATPPTDGSIGRRARLSTGTLTTYRRRSTGSWRWERPSTRASESAAPGLLPPRRSILLGTAWASCTTCTTSRSWRRNRRRAPPRADDVLNGLVVMTFTDAAQWESWLADHYDKRPGVWLKIAKQGSGARSVNATEALEVALCFGWIDSHRKAFDESYFVQKYTPRRPR